MRHGQRYLDKLAAAAENGAELVADLIYQTEVKNKLLELEFHEVEAFWDGLTEWLYKNSDEKGKIPRHGLAYLACNDRYYLLTEILGRVDLWHPWLYARCRDVEYEPYGHLDLWARAHGKSSIITTGGIIQEVIRNPEVTIAIFSATKPLAQEFLAQIKNEFETNDALKDLFPDVLYENPRGKSEVRDQYGNTWQERPAKWSLARGITVRRKGHPKEATVEAHGLIDGQPTGRHFPKHYYDDIVTQDFLSDDQLKKTAERFELADNLGTRHGSEKAIAGTRYHFADAYGVIIERGVAKERRHAATKDGTFNGELVLLTPENWERIKRTQGMKTTAAQMLLNPVAGNEATFSSLWLKTYEVLPRTLNVYILVDPSKGTGPRSDRTAIAVIGLDPAGNKYLLDGVCHRMRLTERFAYMERYRHYYEALPNVQFVRVGYEQYGQQVDIEVIEDLLMAKSDMYTIEELSTPKQGRHSKGDRIERLEPDIRAGRFYLPCVVHHPEFGLKTGEFAGQCYWSVWSESDAAAAKKVKKLAKYHLGQIIYRPVKGLTRLQQEFGEANYRIVHPLKRLDENKNAYDLTRIFIDEMVRHPFAQHDDLIDAVSRIYDIDPLPPVQYDAKALESIDVDDSGIIQASPEEGVDYDD